MVSDESTQSAALALRESGAVQEFSAFGNMQNFTDAQRMAKALCSSSIVPETYRGEGRIGDCIIALELANRIGASVLAVMQNLYIVYGRPAWSSQFLISCVNASKKFTPLRYGMTGTKGQDDHGCIAWAIDKTGERLETPEVTIGMAKAEGWYQKNGSKWKTMPELMLRYRAATLFARLYAPELTMGINTDDEIIDIGPVVTDPVQQARQVSPNFAPADDKPSAGEAAQKEPGTSKGSRSSGGRKTSPPPAQKEKEPAAEPETPPSPAESAKARAESVAADPTLLEDGSPQQALASFVEDGGYTFDHFIRWVKETERIENADSITCWAELPAAFCLALQKDARSLSRCAVRMEVFKSVE